MTETFRDIENKLCTAALKLAASRPWETLTLAQIAKEARLPLVRAKKAVVSPDDLLPAIVEQTNAAVTALYLTAPHEAALKDRLFELLMARLECLQKQRAAALSIQRACLQDSKLAKIMLRAQWRAMEATLELAQWRAKGIGKLALTGFFLALYQVALLQWQRDTTSDLSKTMAALDRSLGNLEAWASFFRYPKSR